MIKKYLDKLEYNTISDMLLQKCFTYIGKELAKKLHPFTDYESIQKALQETTEACNLIHSLGNFPIYEVKDQSLNVKKLNSSMPLSAKSLLEIGSILKTSSELKDYYKIPQDMLVWFGDDYLMLKNTLQNKTCYAIYNTKISRI